MPGRSTIVYLKSISMMMSNVAEQVRNHFKGPSSAAMDGVHVHLHVHMHMHMRVHQISPPFWPMAGALSRNSGATTVACLPSTLSALGTQGPTLCILLGALGYGVVTLAGSMITWTNRVRTTIRWNRRYRVLRVLKTFYDRHIRKRSSHNTTRRTHNKTRPSKVKRIAESLSRELVIRRLRVQYQLRQEPTAVAPSTLARAGQAGPDGASTSQGRKLKGNSIYLIDRYFADFSQRTTSGVVVADKSGKAAWKGKAEAGKSAASRTGGGE